jgi:hypothetical protein
MTTGLGVYHRQCLKGDFRARAQAHSLGEK